jgi:hypothetical protein
MKLRHDGGRSAMSTGSNTGFCCPSCFTAPTRRASKAVTACALVASVYHPDARLHRNRQPRIPAIPIPFDPRERPAVFPEVSLARRASLVCSDSSRASHTAASRSAPTD